jgi:hypothetical protein
MQRPYTLLPSDGTVRSSSQLYAALRDLHGKGGVITLEPGEYGKLDLSDLSGTEAKKLVLQASEKGAATFSNSRGGLVGYWQNVHHFHAQGLVFRPQPGAVWALAAGWINPYPGSPRKCSDVRFTHNLVDGANCSQAVFTVNGSSTDWVVLDNEIIGGAGETIYVGGSPNYDDRGKVFTISRNIIRGGPQSRGVGGGEAIDIKPLVQNVVIQDNLIYDMVVSHSGVIVAAQNDKMNAYADGLVDILILNNHIYNCRPSNKVPNGATYYGASVINPCSEGVDVIGNVIWDCPDLDAISVGGMTGNNRSYSETASIIEGNTTWNTKGSITYGGYGGTPTRTIVRNNRVHVPVGGGFPTGSSVRDNEIITSFTPPPPPGDSAPPPPPPPPPEPEPEPPAPAPDPDLKAVWDRINSLTIALDVERSKVKDLQQRLGEAETVVVKLFDTHEKVRAALA